MPPAIPMPDAGLNPPFGENNARLHQFTSQQRSALDDDRFAQLKKDYLLNGTARSNLADGYIRKPRS